MFYVALESLIFSIPFIAALIFKKHDAEVFIGVMLALYSYTIYKNKKMSLPHLKIKSLVMLIFMLSGMMILLLHIHPIYKFLMYYLVVMLISYVYIFKQY